MLFFVCEFFFVVVGSSRHFYDGTHPKQIDNNVYE